MVLWYIAADLGSTPLMLSLCMIPQEMQTSGKTRFKLGEHDLICYSSSLGMAPQGVGCVFPKEFLFVYACLGLFVFQSNTSKSDKLCRELWPHLLSAAESSTVHGDEPNSSPSPKMAKNCGRIGRACRVMFWFLGVRQSTDHTGDPQQLITPANITWPCHIY